MKYKRITKLLSVACAAALLLQTGSMVYASGEQGLPDGEVSTEVEGEETAESAESLPAENEETGAAEISEASEAEGSVDAGGIPGG